MRLAISKNNKPPEYDHTFYINVQREGHSVTYATEMGVCDYQGVFKGVSARGGAHMTQCLDYQMGKAEIILRIIDYLDEGCKFDAFIDIKGEEHRLNGEDNFEDFMVLIDKAFANTFYTEELKALK